MDRDSEAFQGLMTDWQTAIYRHIQWMGMERETARDLLQETNLTILEKAEDFDPDSDFRAWVFRIATLNVLQWRRKMARDQLVFSDKLANYLAQREADRADLAEQRLECLRECLDGLSQRQRDRLEQRYAEGGTTRGLAELERRTPEVMSQILYRVRKALLDCIRQKLAGETV